MKDRTTISSSTTLPYDEPDYAAALTFALSETTRLVGQLRREQLQARELSLTIRFDDFTETGGAHRFREAQFQNSVINAELEKIFREMMSRGQAGAADSPRTLEPEPARHAADALGQDRGRTLGRARRRDAQIERAVAEARGDDRRAARVAPARRRTQNSQGQMPVRAAARMVKNSGAPTPPRWRTRPKWSNASPQ